MMMNKLQYACSYAQRFMWHGRLKQLDGTL